MKLNLFKGKTTQEPEETEVFKGLSMQEIAVLLDKMNNNEQNNTIKMQYTYREKQYDHIKYSFTETGYVHLISPNGDLMNWTDDREELLMYLSDLVDGKFSERT